MVDVQFDTDNQFKTVTSSSIGIVRAENKMVEWLMQLGVVKNRRHAMYALVLTALIALCVGIFFLLRSWNVPHPQGLPPPEDRLRTSSI